MEFPKEYPLAVAVALGMGVQGFIFGGQVGQVRKQVFNIDFLNK